jgi:hypothetical protein
MSIQGDFEAIQGGPWIAWTVQLDHTDHNSMHEMKYFKDIESLEMPWL